MCQLPRIHFRHPPHRLVFCECCCEPDTCREHQVYRMPATTSQRRHTAVTHIKHFTVAATPADYVLIGVRIPDTVQTGGYTIWLGTLETAEYSRNIEIPTSKPGSVVLWSYVFQHKMKPRYCRCRKSCRLLIKYFISGDEHM